MVALILAGALAGLGLTVAVREFMPARPDLDGILLRLSGPSTRVSRTQLPEQTGLQQRVGAAVERRVDGIQSIRIPRQDLALLEKSVSSFLGEKALLAFIGLAVPSTLAALLQLAGLQLPIIIPGFAALLFATALWFGPDGDVKRKAGQMRLEMSHAVTAYLDATALARLGGADPRQALSRAAQADSWVFVRIRDAIDEAVMGGSASWDGLHTLAVELDVRELDGIADIMRMSGEEGANVYDSLIGRGKALRSSLLNEAQKQAKEQSEQMLAPVSALGIMFLVLLGVPLFLPH